MSKKRCVSCGDPVEGPTYKCSDCGNKVCKKCIDMSSRRCKECIEFEKMKKELSKAKREKAREHQDPAMDMFPGPGEEKSNPKKDTEAESDKKMDSDKGEKANKNREKEIPEETSKEGPEFEGFHIIEIDIENNKNIKAFFKVLDGEDLIVAGDTGIGKTTAISVLWNILETGDDQIRHGEDRAKIKCKLSDGSKTIVCKREYYKSGGEQKSRIKLMDSEGERVSVKDFKKMLSDLSVNPHKIAEMDPLPRTNTLIRSAGIEEQIKDIDRNLEEAKEERTFLNRRRKESDPGEEPEKVEPVNISEKTEKLKKRIEYNNKVEKRKIEVEELESEVYTIEEKIESIENELENLKSEYKEKGDELDELLKETEGEEVVDLRDLEKEINEAEERNNKASRWTSWKEKKEEAEETESKYQEVKEYINKLREKKKKLLEEADFPLEGLKIEDGSIIYKGIKFENLGKSEQILVSAGLAKEQIGKVRVVRIDGIESMSEKDFISLRDMFNEANIQVLASRVSRGELEPTEITIEEGEYIEGDKDNG